MYSIWPDRGLEDFDKRFLSSHGDKSPTGAAEDRIRGERVETTFSISFAVKGVENWVVARGRRSRVF